MIKHLEVTTTGDHTSLIAIMAIFTMLNINYNENSLQYIHYDEKSDTTLMIIESLLEEWHLLPFVHTPICTRSTRWCRD